MSAFGYEFETNDGRVLDWPFRQTGGACTSTFRRNQIGCNYRRHERMFPSLGFYRTNLVKCPPMTAHRLRYPSTKEMISCSRHIFVELKATKPRIIVLLGKQVIDFIMHLAGSQAPGFDDNFTYRAHATELVSAPFICVHHPSFVNVYRRKRLAQYRKGIAQAIADICEIEPMSLN